MQRSLPSRSLYTNPQMSTQYEEPEKPKSKYSHPKPDVCVYNSKKPVQDYEILLSEYYELTDRLNEVTRQLNLLGVGPEALRSSSNRF